MVRKEIRRESRDTKKRGELTVLKKLTTKTVSGYIVVEAAIQWFFLWKVVGKETLATWLDHSPQQSSREGQVATPYWRQILCGLHIESFEEAWGVYIDLFLQFHSHALDRSTRCFVCALSSLIVYLLELVFCLWFGDRWGGSIKSPQFGSQKHAVHWERLNSCTFVIIDLQADKLCSSSYITWRGRLLLRKF